MKPHRLQETRKSRTVAQVRMHLKGTLGWLEGYPAERSAAGTLRWMLPPPSAEHREVDRPLVARTVRTVKELASDFPHALPEVVGDVAAFVAGTERVTRWAALAIRDGVPRASLFELEPAYGRAAGAMARDLVARFPVLRATAVALSFRGLMHPRAAVDSLGHLVAHAEAFARATPHVAHAERMWLTLDAVRRNHPREATHGLERALLDPRTHEAALRGGDSPARALQKALQRLGKGKAATLPDVAPPANASLGHALAQWLPELAAMDAPSQKRALALFDLLEPLDAVEGWHTFWETLRVLADRAAAWQRAMSAAERAGTATPKGIGELARKSTSLVATLPTEETPTALLAAIAALGLPDKRALYTDIRATLTRVPLHLEGKPLRAELLVDWSTDRYGSDWPKLLRGFVSGLRTMLERVEGDVGPVLHPFVMEARRSYYASLSSSIAHELTTPAVRARFFAVWEARARADLPPWDDQRALLLARTVPHAPSAAAAGAWLDHVAKAEGYVSSELIAFAAALADDDGGNFGALLDLAMKARFDRHSSRFERWMKGADRVALVRHALLDGHASLLETAFEHVDTLVNAGRAVPDPFAVHQEPLSPTALHEYPPALRPSLGRLAALVADPHAAIARVLGPAFRSRDDIERELRAIRAKLATSASVPLARRAAALERRREEILADPSRGLSPEKLERLAANIELAARRARLERWVAALERSIERELDAILDLGELAQSPLLRTPRTRECVAGILRLDAPSRAIARMVLRARLAGDRWDFRDHPANAAFVAALVRRGVDPAPWIDGIGSWGETAPDVGQVTLRFEDDPLEILEMGKHFGTCLSPSAFNYFSVFANIVDIHKRVLYARDARGKVLGRCLMALTSAGGILTFHAYRHGPMDFEAMVKRFASELARRMGVTVLASGSVKTLVAPDWYDDGPVDRSGRLPFLEAGSELRTGLGAVPLPEVRALCERSMAPLGPSELTLPSVLELPEVAARPELAVAFAPMIAALPAVPEHLLLRLVQLLRAAGRTDLLEEEAVFAAVSRLPRSTHGISGPLLRALAPLFPSRTLRLLRQTRDRGVRTLHGEWNAHRLVAAAEAMRALFRERKALELYRLAVKQDLSAADRTLCRAQIKALKRDTGARRAT